MRKLLVALLLFVIQQVSAQSFSINTDGSFADTSAMLDVKSANKGVLLPRLSQAQRNTIVLPATGLLIYQTNNTPGYYYNTGTPASPSWMRVSNNGELYWSLNDTSIYNNNNGFVGIGTSSPEARLHVSNGSVAFSEPGDVPLTMWQNIPYGAGRRMLWYGDKAAFRAGYIDADQWDGVNIGNYSFATGYNTQAIGVAGIAMGYYTTANGDYSIAIGSGASANFTNTVALGYNALASASTATALGPYSHANAFGSIAMGNGALAEGFDAVAFPFATATGNGSIAMGEGAQAFGINSFAFGNSATTQGESAIALGSSATANGNYSFAAGNSVTADQQYSVAIGFNNNSAGFGSVTLGSYLTAYNNSTALGYSNYAYGDGSTVMGYDNTANGDYATVGGNNSTAMGDYAVAIGNTINANGISATAFGSSTTAHGNYSFVAGNGSIVYSNNGVALGLNNEVSGISGVSIGSYNYASELCVAIGNTNTVSQYASSALGNNLIVAGLYSTGIGVRSDANGNYAMAIGNDVHASGNYSTAMGNFVSTNFYHGSFIIGDKSSFDTTRCDAMNQMVMRFANGYKLYTDMDATVGLQVSPGGNAWSVISDVHKKEKFLPADGETVLSCIRKLKLGSWNYIGQDPKQLRHYGPMAQEFFAAFGKDKYGLIGNDTTINQADFDGINLIAIQALEKRTQQLQETEKELKNIRIGLQTKDVELLQLKNEVGELKKMVLQLQKNR